MSVSDLSVGSELLGYRSVLGRVHGDVSRGQRLFRAALVNVQLADSLGEIRLDEDHRTAGTLDISQYRRRSRVVFRLIRVVPNVDAIFGGYLRPSRPLPTGDTCHARTAIRRRGLAGSSGG
jgi:hypothetical protein